MNALKAAVGDVISALVELASPLFVRPGARVLMYHAVGGQVAGDRHHIYSIAPELFASHVRSLAAAFGRQAASLDKVVAAGEGLAITFDDGYRDNLTVAAPHLIAASLPFTVFVTLEFMDSGRQYLSRTELKELASLPGVSIGAHGLTHRALTQLSDVDLADELYGSKARLEDLVGRPVSSMSYPYGAVDRRVRAAVRRASYRIAACSRFGGFSPGDDPFEVPRVDVWANDSPRRLLAKTRGRWDWMSWRG